MLGFKVTMKANEEDNDRDSDKRGAERLSDVAETRVG
jgi:hypothetical protein